MTAFPVVLVVDDDQAILVEQQVRLHGGTFELSESPRRGTRARVVLPGREATAP